MAMIEPLESRRLMSAAVGVSVAGSDDTVVAGRRSHTVADVSLANTDGAAALVTVVHLQLNLTPVDGGTATPLTHVRRSLHLTPGGSTVVRLTLGTPPAGLAGAYDLTATLTGPTIPTATATAAATLTLVPAVVNLVPTVLLPGARSVARGSTLMIQYALTNTGTVATPKPLLLRLIAGLSVDGLTIDSASNTPVHHTVRVAPGRTVRFTLRLYVPIETVARQYAPGVRGAIGMGSGTVVGTTPIFVVS